MSKMKTLICTLGEHHEPILTAFRTFGCNKLIIFYEDFKEKSQQIIDIIKKAIPAILIPSEFIEIRPGTLGEMTQHIRKSIILEFDRGNEIYVNISGGRNTLVFAMQQACYIEYDKVSRLFYIGKEPDQIIDLPIIHWRLSDSKRYILGLFIRDKFRMHEIATVLLLSYNMVYKHVTQLVEEGFLEKKGEKFVLTPFGELMADTDILNRLENAFRVATSIHELDSGKGVALKRIMKYIDKEIINAGVSSFNTGDWAPGPTEEEILRMIQDAIQLNYVEELIPDYLIEGWPAPEKWKLKIASGDLQNLEVLYHGPPYLF